MSDMILGSRWQETELEYAVKGTSARLIEAEAAIARVRELHRPTDDPDADHDGKWCVECAKGWDGHDFDLIEYPCATIRTINEGESK